MIEASIGRTDRMLRSHLLRHGLVVPAPSDQQLAPQRAALKAAALTLGHGIHPRISGRRATHLHNELWDRSRLMSVDDITHRLTTRLYPTVCDALVDLDDHLRLYNEEPRLGPLRAQIEALWHGPNIAARTRLRG